MLRVGSLVAIVPKRGLEVSLNVLSYILLLSHNTNICVTLIVIVTIRIKVRYDF
jgi:hypothetical protein